MISAKPSILMSYVFQSSVSTMDPLATLITAWWQRRGQQPKRHEIPAMRFELWKAVFEHLQQHRAIGQDYDPTEDSRVGWACEWLQFCAGDRARVSPDRTARCGFILGSMPSLPDRKRLAAGDR